MNNIEAKRILLAWRPGSADAHEPDVAEALALAQRDPELREWLVNQRAFQGSMKEAFRRVPVPGDLRNRILARSRIVRPAFWSWHGVMLAAAAAVVMLAGVGAWRFVSSADDTFSTLRGRMVRSVLRQYSMDIVTSDMLQIRQFLATNQAPSDYVLPPALARAPALGAGLLSWQEKRVSMVCLNGGAQGTLFLFVVDRSAVKQPPGSVPEFTAVSKLMTASWSQGARTYILAAPGKIEELQKYF